MKLKTKLNCAIWLSIVAIVFSVVMFIIWCCNAGGFRAVNLDTFVGVIVALLAIIVTVAIGWQIYAAMDLKLNITILDTRIKEVEELKKHFGQQQHAIEQLSLKNKHITGYTWGESAMKEQNYTGAFRYFIISLSSSLQLDSPINVENILLFIQKISQNISNHTKCSKEYLQDVIEADKVIRSLRTFALIEDRYKTSYEYILSKIEIDDNQK